MKEEGGDAGSPLPTSDSAGCLGVTEGCLGLQLCHGPHLGSQRSLGGTGEGFYPLVLNMNLCLDLGAPAALPYRDILPHCPSVATFVPTVTPQGLSRCLLGC